MNLVTLSESNPKEGGDRQAIRRGSFQEVSSGDYWEGKYGSRN